MRWESGEKLESVTAPYPSPMAGLWGAGGVPVWGNGRVNLEWARGPDTFHGPLGSPFASAQPRP